MNTIAQFSFDQLSDINIEDTLKNTIPENVRVFLELKSIIIEQGSKSSDKVTKVTYYTYDIRKDDIDNNVALLTSMQAMASYKSAKKQLPDLLKVFTDKVKCFNHDSRKNNYSREYITFTYSTNKPDMISGIFHISNHSYGRSLDAVVDILEHKFYADIQRLMENTFEFDIYLKL